MWWRSQRPLCCQQIRLGLLGRSWPRSRGHNSKAWRPPSSGALGLRQLSVSHLWLGLSGSVASNATVCLQALGRPLGAAHRAAPQPRRRRSLCRWREVGLLPGQAGPTARVSEGCQDHRRTWPGGRPRGFLEPRPTLGRVPSLRYSTLPIGGATSPYCFGPQRTRKVSSSRPLAGLKVSYGARATYLVD